MRHNPAGDEVTPVWKRPPVLIGAGVGLLLLIVGVVLNLALGGKPEPTKDATGPSNPPPGQPVSPKLPPTAAPVRPSVGPFAGTASI